MSRRRIASVLEGLLAAVALATLYLALLLLATRLLEGWRADLTDHHQYTLAPGTIQIARSPDEPVLLTLYFSRQSAGALPALSEYAAHVRMVLAEVHRASRGKVQVQWVDPKPGSQSEERALAAGLSAPPIGPDRQRVIFGLVGTNATTGIAVIPFLQPDRRAFLEYAIARLIHELVTSQRSRVGLISGLPVEGATGGQGGSAPPWTAFQELDQLFRVQILDGRTLQTVPKDLRALLLVQPDNLSSQAVAAIRDYVLRGGHLAVFIDPDPETLPPVRAVASARATWDALRPLFLQWGVAFDPDRVVIDPGLAGGAGSMPDNAPQAALLGLGPPELSRDDVVTAGLHKINVATSGSFEQIENANLRMVPLLQSSGDATAIPVSRMFDESDDAQRVLASEGSSRGRFVLAARLTGMMAGGSKPADIVLVADTDILSNALWVRKLRFLDQILTDPIANNGDFLLNTVDNLTGSSALISIRGRETDARPLTRLLALREGDEQAMRARQGTLRRQLEAVDRRLLEIEQARSIPGAAAGTDVGEYRNASEQRERIRDALRRDEREVDDQVDRLRLRVELANVLLMPGLLLLVAVVAAGMRARRRGRG